MKTVRQRGPRADDQASAQAAPQQGGLDNSLVQELMKGGGEALPEGLRAQMEASFGADFGDVRVHQGSAAAGALDATAAAQGRDLHFAPGQYDPGSQEGRELVAHELTHVVQQGGNAAGPMMKGDVDLSPSLEREADTAGARAARGEPAPVHGSAAAGDVQRYSERPLSVQTKEEWDAPLDLRVSDDGYMAVGQSGGYGSHELYAVPKYLAAANGVLVRNKSVIRLTTTSESISGPAPDGSGPRTLNKVVAENVATETEGDEMQLWADCGRSFRDVAGIGQGTGKNYADTTGVYNWKNEEKESSVLDRMGYALGIQDRPRTGTEERETESSSPKGMKNEILDAYFKYGKAYYDALPEDERNVVDEAIGLNRHAAPQVGEGFTMSSGGPSHPGTMTWNFHWAGVVMVSGGDRVTLENYAVGDAEAKNDEWEFQMYGPPAKEGQTFHDQHKATKQHGQSPTTMRVRKRREE